MSKYIILQPYIKYLSHVRPHEAYVVTTVVVSTPPPNAAAADCVWVGAAPFWQPRGQQDRICCKTVARRKKRTDAHKLTACS